MSNYVYSIFALLAPPLPGMAPKEKRISIPFLSREEAETSLKGLKAPPLVTYEIREELKVSEEQKTAEKVVKDLRKEAKSDETKAKMAHGREVGALARGFILSGITNPNVFPGFQGKDSSFIREVLDKVTAINSDQEELAKVLSGERRVRTAAAKKYQPLTFLGLNEAINFEFGSFERPETPEQLDEYLDLLREGQKELLTYTPRVTDDLGQNLIYKKAYAMATYRLGMEIQDVERYLVNNNALATTGSSNPELTGMPKWPLMAVYEKPAKKSKKEDQDSKGPAGTDMKSFRANESVKRRTRRINGLVREEIGYSHTDAIREKGPILDRKKNYNRGEGPMKVRESKSTFSGG